MKIKTMWIFQILLFAFLFPITIAPSGWTYERTFVLYDKETETLWYPKKERLMGIQGVFFQRWLPKVRSEDTQWSKWAKEHPSTKLIR